MDYDSQQYTQSSFYLSWVTSFIIVVRTIASSHTFAVWLPLSGNSKGEEEIGWKTDFSHLAISISVKNVNLSAISRLDFGKPCLYVDFQ